eukprot:2196901-Karenia_brevis.AAC.1
MMLRQSVASMGVSSSPAIAKVEALAIHLVLVALLEVELVRAKPYTPLDRAEVQAEVREEV